MRLIVAANRLPFTIKEEKNSFVFRSSDGGLVSSVGSYLQTFQQKKGNEYLWIGWPGNEISPHFQNNVIKKMAEQNAHPVFFDKKTAEDYYLGYCNKTIWPLFHYFPQFTSFSTNYWEAYKKVNNYFCDEILKVAKPGDFIFVQDYHLMLLPQLLRNKMSSLQIGFFLHIPFPSYDIFKMIPKQWREELLYGLLGADIVGFHTQEYTEHFLETTKNLLGINNSFGRITINTRLVKADTFPLGIDTKKFIATAQKESVIQKANKLKRQFDNKKIILSIDRLDYTKGIINRLKGLEFFLSNNETARGKFHFVLVAIPSREDISEYKEIKKQVDEYISVINGKFGTFEWSPIKYLYSSLPFEDLLALYSVSDIALITPLKDGMNLISKEFVASKINRNGVLILSEMAGAAYELDKALLINPNSEEEISQALKIAFFMTSDEQQKRMTTMQDTIKKQDVFRWAESILDAVNGIRKEQQFFFLQEDTKKESPVLFPWYYTTPDGRVGKLDFKDLL